MTTENNQGRPPTPSAAHERCEGCGATLVDDQRYCLQCGARRGLPRLDFTAFWKQASPTGAPADRSAVAPTGAQASRSGTPEVGATRGGSTIGSWPGAPSRRASGLIAAAVLAAGILAGAALGPAPPNSPADSSTLAVRALAGLMASAGSQTAASPAATTTVQSQASPTPANAGATEPKAKPALAANEASTPSSTESTAPSESSNGAGSEEASPESPSKSSKGTETTPGTPIKLPPIKHVWVITLSDTSLVATASQARTAAPQVQTAAGQAQTDPYLTKQLLPKGALLSGYTLTAPSSLANGIALLSGQGVNLDTEQNCPTYSELQPPTVSATGLAEGVGCVYPSAVQTLTDELTAAGLTWKAYVQGMEGGQAGTASGFATGTAPGAGTSSSTTPTSGAGSTPAAGTENPATTTSSPASAASCRHPQPGAPDPNQVPATDAPYLTFRNPFVYFHSLLDNGACASGDVDFGRFQSDLATPASTPSLSWIVPSACDDGSSAPCAPGAPAGLAPAEEFLKEVVPQILSTAAYHAGGLIVIVPDSGPAPSSWASIKPVGALLLSPFVHAGVHVTESVNDFSLLKSLSRLFGVLPLGHANDPSVASFGATVYGSSGKATKAASTAKKAAQAAPTTPGG